MEAFFLIFTKYFFHTGLGFSIPSFRTKPTMSIEEKSLKLKVYKVDGRIKGEKVKRIKGIC